MALRDIIVVGASAGGVQVLRTHLLPALPKDLRAAVFILMHRSMTGAIPRPQDYLLDLLSRASQLVCAEARDGETLQRGHVYLSPRGRYLRLEKETIRVDDDPAGTVMRTGVDVLFRSAAVAHGDRVAGVVLSGMLSDGSAGLWDVRRHGGVTIVQDPREAEHPGMPANAMNDVAVHYCLRAAEIGPKLVELATKESTASPTMRPARVLIVEDERIAAESLAKRLTGLGYEVVGSVATGEAAVDLVSRVAPDIVLMDVQLAGPMKGTEAARRIWEATGVPSVYLTAYSDEQTLSQARRSMPYGFIVKPCRPSEIHAAIQVALERRERDPQPEGGSSAG